MTRTRSRLRTLAVLFPTLAAVSLAGCEHDNVAPDPGADGGVGGRRPTATLEWNRLALGMIEKHKPGQQAALRGMAYLTLAQFGAADAAEQEAPKTTTAGAIAGASAAVLTYLYPADSAAFEAEVRGREAVLEPGRQAGFRAGEELGRAIGARAVALARTDRFGAPWNGTVPTGPGVWFSSSVPASPPVLPLLGQMQPFYLAAGDQVRPSAHRLSRRRWRRCARSPTPAPRGRTASPSSGRWGPGRSSPASGTRPRPRSSRVSGSGSGTRRTSSP
jgi:hypothetical protein